MYWMMLLWRYVIWYVKTYWLCELIRNIQMNDVSMKVRTLAAKLMVFNMFQLMHFNLLITGNI